MHIKLNEQNELLAYANVGSIESGIEVNQNNFPEKFVENFKPLYYVFKNYTVLVNANYKEPEEEVFDNIVSIKDIIIVNEELLIQTAKLINRIEKLENEGGV